MDELNLEQLYIAYNARLKECSTSFVRYLYKQINWSVRMIGIKGARGVGKTTLLLQRIKLAFDSPDRAMYASLDNIWFDSHSLFDLVNYLNNRGIYWLFLDEVHKCSDWAKLLKNVYDSFPKMNIVYTSSSMLQIDHSQADLSRRQTLYTLNAMSFREYLEYEGIASEESFSLEDILTHHVSIATDLTSKTDELMLHFERYLKSGCYPFYKESGEDFLIRLRETVQTVIDVDMPAVEKVEFETLSKIRKMLMILAVQVPFVPNIETLSNQIASTRNQTLRLLYLLDKAKLLKLITQKAKSYDNLVKPEKILMDNSNLMYCLSSNTEIGTIRETFFANQLSCVGDVTAPQQGDYQVNDRYLFEVGGKKKTYKQIKDIPDSFLAVDAMPVGFGNRIPLWLFGMLY